jgi:hypothetical protein
MIVGHLWRISPVLTHDHERAAPSPTRRHRLGSNGTVGRLPTTAPVPRGTHTADPGHPNPCGTAEAFAGPVASGALSFANYDKPGDRDIASYGVVRMLDETNWEPKKVFHAMAARYQRP